MNVISTSPSSTEIRYALGVEPVAVPHACDPSFEAATLPPIDVSVDAEASAARHEQVRAATADGHLYEMDADGHLYEMDADAIDAVERLASLCHPETGGPAPSDVVTP